MKETLWIVLVVLCISNLALFIVSFFKSKMRKDVSLIIDKGISILIAIITGLFIWFFVVINSSDILASVIVSVMVFFMGGTLAFVFWAKEDMTTEKLLARYKKEIPPDAQIVAFDDTSYMIQPTKSIRGIEEIYTPTHNKCRGSLRHCGTFPDGMSVNTKVALFDIWYCDKCFRWFKRMSPQKAGELPTIL